MATVATEWSVLVEYEAREAAEAPVVEREAPRPVDSWGEKFTEVVEAIANETGLAPRVVET